MKNMNEQLFTVVHFFLYIVGNKKGNNIEVDPL